MTIGEAMFKFLVAFEAWVLLGVAVVLALGLGLGWWMRGNQHTRKCEGADWDVDDALEAWKPVFEPGVAKVGGGE